MEIKYLMTFRTIVEEGSFSAAANKLNYTQSTITFQIGQLEQETGTKLFEKLGRNMVLTGAGKAFIPYVDQVLEAVAHLDSFQAEVEDYAGELQIGVAETFLCYRLPAVLKEIVARAPKAKIQIRSMNCYDIRDALNEGSLDIGLFYRDIGGNMDKLQIQPLNSYPVSMVASPALLKRYPDPFESEQCPVPFLINEKRCIFRQIFEKYLLDKGIHMSHTIELESIETIKKLVQNDVGISFLPRFTVENELKTGSLVEIPADVEHNEITIVMGYHKNKWISPIMQLFVECINGSNFK